MPLFRQLHDSSTAGYSYLVADSEGGEAVAIDVGSERTALLLLALLTELKLRLSYVLCTHGHEGETAVAPSITMRTHAKIVAGESAPVPADARLQHGDSLRFGDESIRVIGTPGHTRGCLSYLWRDRVFTGDTLHIGGCGRTGGAGGDPALLYDSITQRLLMLPGETLVYPGHDAGGRTVSSIGEEREHNPCIAGRSRDEFITQRIRE